MSFNGASYLRPGEICFAMRPLVVVTVLGSCVAVTLHDSYTGWGAICHGMLPRCQGQQSYRFTDYAVTTLLERFQSRGVPPRRLQAKLFGGADMLQNAPRACQQVRVGQQNSNVALEVLAAWNIRVLAQDCGGHNGRKIYFKSYNGEVYLERLNRTVR